MKKQLAQVLLSSGFFLALSVAAPFAITFIIVLAAKRSFFVLLALAVVLFMLFGPLALAGFFLGMGAAALARPLLQKSNEGEGKQRGKKKKRH